MQTEFLISPGEQPKRLDIFLVNREPKLSRAAVQRMISAGRVRVNNQTAKPSQKIKPGDVVNLDKPKPTPLLINGQPSALEILFEDSACLVINKPAGVAAHPGPGHWDDTLLNALLDHALRAGVVGMSGLVHRLDRDTSGVMVVAKTKTAHGRLAVQFEQHSITRQYEALVQGVPQHSHGRIELALGTDRNNVKRTSPHTLHPKASLTEYYVEEVFGAAAAHMVLTPRTGRTHQIRAHLHAIGHPILGDPAYGAEPVRALEGYGVPRVMLHAYKLGFHHPLTGRYCEFTVKPPADFRGLSDELRFKTVREGRGRTQ
ncbi:MAG: RluA family pseudouridine synthase [Nitrospira sp.]|nr:RluA family pseudouridine synthase [Nitrospira sp.]HMZ96391.1 RluA family pseudouridine synthase [Nitrospira sp.]HNA48090.1 RluA family pseudouridine synthase [Nitrospira sp.]HNA85690.1 RluA family pseudouridine synthase [Nitrospira sp.]HNC83585.1 RluA family pseudouridine synthase [Nitrospira sp.]